MSVIYIFTIPASPCSLLFKVGFYFCDQLGEVEKYDEWPELSPYGIIESINANNELVTGRRREVVCTA
jgi:hypothetical protein